VIPGAQWSLFNAVRQAMTVGALPTTGFSNVPPPPPRGRVREGLVYARGWLFGALNLMAESAGSGVSRCHLQRTRGPIRNGLPNVLGRWCGLAHRSWP